jgi:hypothetical protein
MKEECNEPRTVGSEKILIFAGRLKFGVARFGTVAERVIFFLAAETLFVGRETIL